MTEKNKASEQEQEEEAHFFFTLAAFEELVRTYGMEEIMANLNDDGVYADMFDFFLPPENGLEDE